MTGFNLTYYFRNLPKKGVTLAIMLLMTLANGWAQGNQEGQPGYYIERAEGFIQINAWYEAKKVIDQGLADYPDNAELRYLAGRFFYITGRLDEARYNLIKAIQSDEQHYGSLRLLVDVEDETEHYSSAICYVNELLEFQPYDRDLWRRKIGLYRKINNDTEADATLERLARIYPNDSIVNRDLRNRRRLNSNEVLQKSSLEDAALNLEKWLELDPENLDYYLELINTYERMGEFDRAIGAANRGLRIFPRNQELLNKLTGIMSDRGLMTQALNLAHQEAPNSMLYQYLLEELAADTRLRDPYEIHARLYDETHNRDALNYLINTSMARGYYDDAQVYLKEAISLDGRTPALLMKLYSLEVREGNERGALKLLDELFAIQPDDEETVEIYTAKMLELAGREMTIEDWSDAEEHLGKALALMSVDDESWPSAVSRRITCLGRLNRYEEAQLQYREGVISDPINRSRYASAYEELVGSRMKALIEEEDYPGALREAQNLLSMIPKSSVGLRTCINMTQTLKMNDQYHEYALQGYEAYPDEPYFISKQAIALAEQQRYAEALELVKPHQDDFMAPMLTTVRSGISQEWAEQLLKDRLTDIAMETVDSALAYDSKNKDLLYTKGLIYEKQKDYANAYAYQTKNYVPSNAELQEYNQRMRSLRFRSFPNRVDASYTYASFDSKQDDLSTRGHLYSIASVSYSRLGKEDSFTGQVTYKGIDGYHYEKVFTDTDNVQKLYQKHSPGGYGLEFMGQWEHNFGNRWTAILSGAFATKYFNRFGGNLTLSYEMKDGWTPSVRVGYRRTPKTYLYMSAADTLSVNQSEYNLFILTPAMEKEWTERISTKLSVDLLNLKSSIYYNVGFKGKLLINDDNISSVSLMAGFGSFPELTFFDQTALHDLSHTNAMVGVDLQYLLTEHLYLGLSGNWNTYYSPYRNMLDELIDSYRNIYSITLQLHVAF